IAEDVRVDRGVPRLPLLHVGLDPFEAGTRLPSAAREQSQGNRHDRQRVPASHAIPPYRSAARPPTPRRPGNPGTSSVVPDAVTRCAGAGWFGRHAARVAARGCRVLKLHGNFSETGLSARLGLSAGTATPSASDLPGRAAPQRDGCGPLYDSVG